MKIGIVGSGADKFTPRLERQAKQLLREILSEPGAVLVSGHSPVGGIDIWAEEISRELGLPEPIIHAPEVNQWNPPGRYGYKARNLDIARDSDVLHVIVVTSYPPDYQGMRFSACYHCKTDTHVKSGGCWTGKQAEKMGRKVIWHVLG